MPKITHKKKSTSAPIPALPPPAILSPGFSQSRTAYLKVLAYLRNLLGRHPQFDYTMKDFRSENTLALLGDDGKLLGFCGVSPSVPEASVFRASHTVLQITLFEVLESQRGKGLGRAMLDQIADIGRRGGFKSVQTFAIDGAFEFYRKYGFVTDELQRGMNVRFNL
jgi:GNAT superfamily N-acetyltransferase